MAETEVVHKVGPRGLEPLCGQQYTPGMLVAILAHGRGYRWCKKCLAATRG